MALARGDPPDGSPPHCSLREPAGASAVTTPSSHSTSGETVGRCSSSPGQSLLTLPVSFTSASGRLHPAILQRARRGGRERRGKGNPRAKTTPEEHIPGWREGQAPPAASIQQSHGRTCQAARAKYRGREEPGPGRGPPPATLTQPKPATPSTTSSVKSSKAARPSGSCLGTWTMSQPKLPLAEPGLGKKSTGDKPQAPCGPGPRGQEAQELRTLRREPGGRKGAGGDQEGGRLREKEAGSDQLPSPFPSPAPEVGCPTLPKVLCWVTAGRG